MGKNDLYSREHNCIVMAHYLTFYRSSFNTTNEYFCACVLAARKLSGNKWHLETKQNIKHIYMLITYKRWLLIDFHHPVETNYNGPEFILPLCAK